MDGPHKKNYRTVRVCTQFKLFPEVTYYFPSNQTCYKVSLYSTGVAWVQRPALDSQMSDTKWLGTDGLGLLGYAGKAQQGTAVFAPFLGHLPFPTAGRQHYQLSIPPQPPGHMYCQLPCMQYTVYVIPPNLYTEDFKEYDYWLLYDLGSDPYELTNRWASESALSAVCSFCTTPYSFNSASGIGLACVRIRCGGNAPPGACMAPALDSTAAHRPTALASRPFWSAELYPKCHITPCHADAPSLACIATCLLQAPRSPGQARPPHP